MWLFVDAGDVVVQRREGLRQLAEAHYRDRALRQARQVGGTAVAAGWAASRVTGPGASRAQLAPAELDDEPTIDVAS